MPVNSTQWMLVDEFIKLMIDYFKAAEVWELERFQTTKVTFKVTQGHKVFGANVLFIMSDTSLEAAYLWRGMCRPVVRYLWMTVCTCPSCMLDIFAHWASGQMCLPNVCSGQMHLQPQWVTRWRSRHVAFCQITLYTCCSQQLATA